MKNIDELSLLQEIVSEKYGKYPQLLISIEEMSELTKELAKVFRNKENIENIKEEIADVYNCLEQLRIFYKLDDCTLYTTQLNKMKRQYERIKEEEGE